MASESAVSPPDDPHRRHRSVVSFVRRSDRLSAAQQKHWDAHHRDWVVDVPRGDARLSLHPDHRIDPDDLFGRPGELIVEIGPGMGDSLAPMAAARAEANVLAFEVYQPAIARILAKLAREGAENVRVVQADAGDGLRQLATGVAVDELWMFFPDPWPKTKHHKRRLLDPGFADLVATRLRPGALWRLATDWADYADQMRDVLDAHPEFVRVDPDTASTMQDAATGAAEEGAGEEGAGEESAGEFPERWSDRVQTKFERRGLAAGHRIVDLAYRRR